MGSQSAYNLYTNLIVGSQLTDEKPTTRRYSPRGIDRGKVEIRLSREIMDILDRIADIGGISRNAVIEKILRKAVVKPGEDR